MKPIWPQTCQSASTTAGNATYCASRASDPAVIARPAPVCPPPSAGRAIADEQRGRRRSLVSKQRGSFFALPIDYLGQKCTIAARERNENHRVRRVIRGGVIGLAWLIAVNPDLSPNESPVDAICRAPQRPGVPRRRYTGSFRFIWSPANGNPSWSHSQGGGPQRSASI